MNKLLTIAIPAYNVEKYIAYCLSSCIVNINLQKYLEVIIINDGSTDNTKTIVESYRKRFPKLFHIIHKENGGHGSCINTGIMNATGKYFKILDSDDWLNTNTLESLIEQLLYETSDVILHDYYFVDSTTLQKLRIQTPFDSKKQKYTKPSSQIYTFPSICNDLYMRMHTLTFKTSILKSQNITITEHCFYVDQEYVIYPIPYITTLHYIPEVLYMYRIQNKEQSMHILNMQKNLYHHETVLKHLLKFYRNLDKTTIAPYKLKYIEKMISYCLGSQIKIYLSFSPSNIYYRKIIQLDRYMYKHYPPIYKSVKNKNIWLLRISKYSLYPLASLLYRFLYIN